MKVIKDNIVFNGKYLQVTDREFTNRSGGVGHWEVVSRKTHGKIVAVVPITPENEVVLIRIYRMPAQKWIIEFCAGLADVKGENPEDLARRECLEETGYKVGKLRKIMDGPFNAGLLADEMIVYLGYDAEWGQEQQLEDNENIEVVKIPVKELYSYLDNPPADTLVDIKIYGLIPFLE